MSVLSEEYQTHKLTADGFHYNVKTLRSVGVPFFWRWLGFEKFPVEYYGNDTVWRQVFRDEKGEISRMIRCPSWREGWLADVYARIKMQDSEEKEDASLN